MSEGQGVGGVGSGSELLREIARALVHRGWSLALAESCTGGLVTKMLTDYSGSSEYLRGSVIAYANEVKRDLLGVSQSSLSAHGAVSKEVAIEMATGAARVLRTDVGVAVTGIAGPAGGTREKPVGTVWLAVATPEGVNARHALLPGDRAAVREAAAHRALQLLMDQLAGSASANPRDVSG